MRRNNRLEFTSGGCYSGRTTANSATGAGAEGTGLDEESGVIISLQVRKGDKRDRLMSWMRENESATPEEIMDKALMLHREAIKEQALLDHIQSGSPPSHEEVRVSICVFSQSDVTMPTPDDIINEVCRYYQVSAEDIRGASRRRNITTARYVSAYLIRHLSNQSLLGIGEIINRHHLTVQAAIRRIDDQAKTNKSISDSIRDITNQIKSKQQS